MNDTMQVQFVKGHCGWDALTLVPADQVPEERALETALKIVSAPVDGGLEAGFMSRGERPGEIRLKILNSTTRTWIPMCGGMSQVIGKALVETFLREHFAIDAAGPTVRITLLTAAGAIPLEIEVRDGRVANVVTTMDAYVSYLHENGIEPLLLNGIEALHVGEFLVFELSALERSHPELDFTRRDSGRHREIIDQMLKEYRRWRGARFGVYGMMYDARPEGPGQFRIFPRFYSDDQSASQIPWEFQCGTGTVAVGVALAHRAQLPFTTSTGSVLFEWGSRRTTPDPYGIRTSRLNLALENGRVTRASFSHSVVEILAEGTLTLPGYR